MNILRIIFYLGLASYFLGVFTFPYRDILIGLCALIIAIVEIVALFRSGKP
jgi:hypothetical protein